MELPIVGIFIIIAVACVILYFVYTRNVTKRGSAAAAINPTRREGLKMKEQQRTQSGSGQRNKVEKINQGAKNVPVKRSTKHELSLSTIKRHTDVVVGVDWDDSAKILVTASDDRTVRVWDCRPLISKNPVEKRRINMTATDGSAAALALSPGGAYLMLALRDRYVIQIWKTSVPKGKDPKLMEAEVEWPMDIKRGVRILGLVWCSDGRWVATLHTDDTLRVFTKRGDALLSTRVGSLELFGLAASIDCTLVAVASSNKDVSLWNIGNGVEPAVTRGGALTGNYFDKGHSAPVRAVAFGTPLSGESSAKLKNTGRPQALTGSSDGCWKVSAALWQCGDSNTGQDARVLISGDVPITSVISAVCTGPSGSNLLVVATQTEGFWFLDARSGRSVSHVPGSLCGSVVGLRMSSSPVAREDAPDMHVLASWTDERNGGVKLWNVPALDPLIELA